jgi:hypothetical protein
LINWDLVIPVVFANKFANTAGYWAGGVGCGNTVVRPPGHSLTQG